MKCKIVKKIIRAEQKLLEKRIVELERFIGKLQFEQNEKQREEMMKQYDCPERF